MGSKAEGKKENQEEEEEGSVWDSIAEEELRAIEDDYYASNSKRPNIPTADNRQEPKSDKRRRLPNWSDHRRWALSPPSCQVRFPVMNFTGKVVYCRTSPEIEQATTELLQKIKSTPASKSTALPMGFDIEWRPTFRRGGAQTKAAVMQICIEASTCYVMHIIHTGIPPLLRSLLADPTSVKVGVCIANDAVKISRDYDVPVAPLDDLSTYANFKLRGPTKRWSLASLTEMLTCKQLEKPGKIRMGNWEKNVLSKEQIQYAATDAYVSWYLYQILMTFPDAESKSEQTAEVDVEVAP